MKERKQWFLKLFTLIKLLIVITIIAILASLLLPALNAARDKGKTAACTNLMKQAGLAMTQYADSYNDYMISGTYVFEKTQPWAQWYGQMWPFLTGRQIPNSLAQVTHSPLDCPSSAPTEKYHYNNIAESWIVTSYGWNGLLCPSMGGHNGKKIIGCRYPSQSSVMWDAKLSLLITTWKNHCMPSMFNSTDVQTKLDSRHKPYRVNHLFVDGYVELLDTRSLTWGTTLFIRYLAPYNTYSRYWK